MSDTRSDPLFVTAYTSEAYRKMARRLESSCLNFDVECRTFSIPTRGSWVRNTHIKPHVILSAMEETGRPIVWVDADAELKARPEAFYQPPDCDAGLHIHRRKGGYAEWLSGTTYWTEKAKPVLELWDELGKDYPNVWDQVTMRAALNLYEIVLIKGSYGNLGGPWVMGKAIKQVSSLVQSCGEPLKLWGLPPELCYVDRIWRHIHPQVRPVIYHHQASRRLPHRQRMMGELR